MVEEDVIAPKQAKVYHCPECGLEAMQPGNCPECRIPLEAENEEGEFGFSDDLKEDEPTSLE